MSKVRLSSTLVLLLIFITMTSVPTNPILDSNQVHNNLLDETSPDAVEDNESTPDDRPIRKTVNHYDLAYDAPADGVLDPVQVEQSGYAASENISARTDSFQNLVYDLPLDVTHDWVADKAEVSVWNLEKLYVVNGTYDQGFAGVNVNPNDTIDYYPLGWSANSTDTATFPDDVQLAAYDDSGRKFVMVENQGGKVGQNAFGHAAGTQILWTQTVQNAPYTEDFLLNFDYFYLRGPLDKGGDPISGNCSIKVYIDGTPIWSMSLLTLSQRGVWTDSGVIPLTVTGAPSSFVFEIGLVVDEYLELDKRDDYDNNGIADGIGNAAYITVYLDDVSFIKAIPPTPEQVQLELSTGGTSVGFTGSMGSYYSSITNSSYWTATPVPVTMTSNTSVSFDYKARLHSHRFTDSNWRTNIDDIGVAFTIDHGISSDVTFYSYIGYLGNYEDPEMMVVMPTDWENITISDPFLKDMTVNCTVGSGYLVVPTSIIGSLGWWQVEIQSPNYAKSIKSQILDVSWTDASLFRVENTTRADITIGTATQILGSLTGVNVSWFKPNDEVWVSEILPPGGVLGQIYSNSHTFPSGSSPAGLWWVEVYWTNGTEVAYNRVSFEMRHTADLVAEPSEITTDAGSIIKGIVRYTDGETGAYLMDTSATLDGNWSGSSIPFAPNSIQNWWEADFDTSLTGAGRFDIIVTASRPYYDDISCLISVHSINVTRLTSPNAPWTAEEWGSIVTLKFFYDSYDSASGNWWHVRNESDVSVSVNWTIGFWSVTEDTDIGFYIIAIDSGIMASGTYLLNTTFSKPDHETKTLLLTLILSPLTSSLAIFDGTADRVDLEQSKIIKLGYVDKYNQPVQGASVSIDSVTPSTGLSHSTIDPVAGEEGNYTVTLTPYSATVFTVRFVATGSNSEPASAVFILVVNDVLTDLEIFGSTSIEIGLTETYNTTFRYELFNGTGVESAVTSIVYSGPTGKLSWNVSETGLGNYSVEFGASLPGTYVITIIAFKPYHQRASSSFSLIVENIPTELLLSVGSSSEMGLTDTYEMTVLYRMGLSETGIEDAAIDVFYSGSPSAISPQVTPLGLGNYSVQFTASLSGSYLVTITASKQYHQSSSDSFLLVVRGITTNFASLNGSADFVGFGKDYRLFVEYTNTSGYGLSGANVSVVNADAGITWGPTQPGAPGIYSILFTPLSSNTFSVIIQANLTNHQTKTVFFALTVTAIPTTLTTLNLSTSISADQNFTVYLQFQDEDTNPLENASLGILNPPQNIQYTSFEELGSGVYRVTLTPLITGTFDIVFRASKDGYQTDYAGFTLTATNVPTELIIAGGLSSDSMKYGQTYELVVFYRRTDTLQNVSGAAITVETTRTGLAWSSEEADGGYKILITPDRVANWTLDIFANRTNYVRGYRSFVLRVDPVLISLGFVTDLTAMEGSNATVIVRLTESETTNPIDGAKVLYRFSPEPTGLFVEMKSTGTPGEYYFSTFVPLYASSQYRLEIKVEKENYVLPGQIDLSFTITQSPERMGPIIAGGSGVGILLVVFFVALRIYSGRKKKQLETDLANKRRFDDADNIIGAIVMHKKSGIPIYSRIVKGGFEEGIVAAFISAVTHFREEFEMFDEESMAVIPISDIIRAVQTRNLICAFITVRSASMDHNRKMEAYGMQVGTYLDDLYDGKPSSQLDEKVAEMLDYIFETTMDGSLLRYYKIATSGKFPRNLSLVEKLLLSEETKHCSRPVQIAQGITRFGVTEARGCTLVLESIKEGLITQCEEHESAAAEFDFSKFFADRNQVKSDDTDMSDSS
ncbi:MAG: hypothetical protein ACFFCP_00220 [Promethearchaeota archaeon]